MLKEFQPEIEAILQAGKTKPQTAPTTAPQIELNGVELGTELVVVTPSVETDIMRRFSNLQLSCLAHRYLYYVELRPIISDQEYDRIEAELRALRIAFPVLWEASEFQPYCPTEHVGSEMAESYPEQAILLAREKLVDYEDLRQQFGEN